jgi:hypothetical protein
MAHNVVLSWKQLQICRQSSANGKKAGAGGLRTDSFIRGSVIHTAQRGKEDKNPLHLWYSICRCCFVKCLADCCRVL